MLDSIGLVIVPLRGLEMENMYTFGMMHVRVRMLGLNNFFSTNKC